MVFYLQPIHGVSERWNPIGEGLVRTFQLTRQFRSVKGGIRLVRVMYAHFNSHVSLDTTRSWLCYAHVIGAHFD